MKKSVFFILSALFIFSSCSLKYDDSVEVDGNIPEFILSEINMTQYKDGKSSMSVEAERVEQFKGSSESYAKNLSFKSINSESKVTSEGKCGYLFSDSENKIYEMYDDIEVENHDDNTKFYADALRYNEKTEQLTGSRTDSVRIEKNGTVISGSGFAASGVTRNYSFSGAVTGDIETK